MKKAVFLLFHLLTTVGKLPEPLMKLLFMLTIALTLVVYFAGEDATADDEWEYVYTAANLLVKRRDYQGSDLQEIQGVTRLRSSLGAVMALLKDAKYNRHWVYRSGGATILREEGYSLAYVYGIVDAPWPMRDRDTIVRFSYRQHPQTKTITITITNFPEFIARKDQFVRVPDFGGYWQLEPEIGGWTRVTYQVYGDPGGRIPVWIANYAAAMSVVRTLQNMASAVQHYAGAESSHVKELPD